MTTAPAAAVGDVLEVSAPAGDFGVPTGDGPLLLATAVLTVGQIVPLGFQRVARYVSSPLTRPEGAGTGAAPPAPRGAARAVDSRVPLFVFVGCCVLVMHGDTIKFAYLPLYMANQLGISDTLRGAVIAIQPLAELALMPLFAIRPVIMASAPAAESPASRSVSGRRSPIHRPARLPSIAEPIAGTVESTPSGSHVTLEPQR